jgi:hypothetical protein
MIPRNDQSREGIVDCRQSLDGWRRACPCAVAIDPFRPTGMGEIGTAVR